MYMYYIANFRIGFNRIKFTITKSKVLLYFRDHKKSSPKVAQKLSDLCVHVHIYNNFNSSAGQLPAASSPEDASPVPHNEPPQRNGESTVGHTAPSPFYPVDFACQKEGEMGCCAYELNKVENSAWQPLDAIENAFGSLESSFDMLAAGASTDESMGDMSTVHGE